MLTEVAFVLPGARGGDREISGSCTHIFVMRSSTVKPIGLDPRGTLPDPQGAPFSAN